MQLIPGTQCWSITYQTVRARISTMKYVSFRVTLNYSIATMSCKACPVGTSQPSASQPTVKWRWLCGGQNLLGCLFARSSFYWAKTNKPTLDCRWRYTARPAFWFCHLRRAFTGTVLPWSILGWSQTIQPQNGSIAPLLMVTGLSFGCVIGEHDFQVRGLRGWPFIDKLYISMRWRKHKWEMQS